MEVRKILRPAFAPSTFPGANFSLLRHGAGVRPSTVPRRRPRAAVGPPEGDEVLRDRSNATASSRKQNPAFIVAIEEEDRTRSPTASGRDDPEPLGAHRGLDGGVSGEHKANSVPPTDELRVDVQSEANSSRAESNEDAGLINFSIFGRDFSVQSRYLLYTVPFMWGTFGPAVRVLFMSDPHPEPSVFNSERLLLSNAVYFPVLLAEVSNIRRKFRGRLRTQIRAEKALARDEPARVYDRNRLQAVDLPEERDPFFSIRAGVELGAYVFCANVAQVIGLQSTSASRAAFLVQLQTVFIPVIAAAMGVNKVSRNTWIGSVIAVAGVALLSADKSHGTISSVFGDSLEVLSALFFSMYVVRLGNYCARIEAAALVAVKLVVQACLSFGWALSMEAMLLAGPHAYGATHVDNHPWTFHALAINVAVVAWTGLISSALSGWLQSKAQQTVPASETAVIFATQPLWASATAAVFLGEAFGVQGLTGGAMIILATLLASIPDGDGESDANSDSGT